MRRLLPILFVVVLAGCSASAQYDIDMSCHDNPTALAKIYADAGETFMLTCYAPEYFEISCDSKTVQRIGSGYLCSTHDGKTVRIVRKP